ncbi:hypothetical protein AUEXF2481DRAFT_615917 [Aureobasidium subglaciale EXF-2481]|uniref:Uncharacterized protein n=1 Tax=Aureobasidium subglaciale (strain EXF-2481) TaxID=1043005 RepID=A0A074YGB6_AURSE|nr:uncharacterized protein AUEXF2481DRAFT_615917 [Aureobasidium subglaciale EXF-2481]KEQ96873.1 hypothetical protein AUEXF2481DRAFT_615917 [Aureobasidium subglaciale EXF-2481]
MGNMDVSSNSSDHVLLPQHSKQHFQFLDLHGEIQNMIYEHSFEKVRLNDFMDIDCDFCLDPADLGISGIGAAPVVSYSACICKQRHQKRDHLPLLRDERLRLALGSRARILEIVSTAYRDIVISFHMDDSAARHLFVLAGSLGPVILENEMDDTVLVVSAGN